jgi:hypothetical protein
MTAYTCVTILVGAMILPAAAGAQTAPAVAARALRGAVTTASPGTSPASVQTLIQNRARTLGGQVSPNGTRYWVATDLSLVDASPDALLDRLSPPPVTASDHIRTLEILVNIRRPLTVRAAPGQAVAIGAAIISATAVKQITVNAQIVTNRVTIFNK